MDPWLEGLWNAIKAALSKMASDRTGYLTGESGDSPKDAPDSSIPDVQLLSITDQQNCKSAKSSVETVSKFASAASSSVSAFTTQTAITDQGPASPLGNDRLAPQFHDVASVSSSKPGTQTTDTGVSPVALAASLTCSLPPLSESSLNVPALSPSYLDVSLQEASLMEQAQVRNSNPDRGSL